MHFHSSWPLTNYARSATSMVDPRLGNPINIGIESEEIGNAVGFGNAVFKAALGELSERRHFSIAVPVHDASPLRTLADTEFRLCCTRALNQTSNFSEPDLLKIQIPLTRCRRLSDGKPILAPRCMIALNSDEEWPDTNIMPIRDTSGCSAHITPELALDASLREFIERQVMVTSWISGNGANLLEDLNKEVIANLEHVSGAWNILCEVGRITCLSLSNSLGAYVVFSIFEAKNPTDLVQFSCGMGSHWDAGKALEKAILELWHTFVATPIKIEEAIKENSRIHALDHYYLGFNHQRGPEKIRFLESAKKNPLHVDKFLSQSQGSPNESIRILSQISEHILWYSGVEFVDGVLFIVSKVFSPDFFLHIDTSRHLNFHNAFSKYQCLDIETFDRSPTCFP